ncbi:hypothetical protein [Longimicrobium sp.]|uniref:hypothetical protein n=1 Tax=Longimicrobium sp. TaxID=2029185 RepID=UPI003B3B1175
MRSSLTRPSGAARLGSRLLLALALCACGGGADDDAPEARQADAAAASASQATGPAACPAPPTVTDPKLFTGPWAVFSRHMTEIGARFAEPSDSSTATVRFCKDCGSAEVQIVSEATTYCTTPEQMDSGGSRILAIMVLKSAYAGNPEQGWEPIPANDSIFMFAGSTDGPATLVYRSRDRRNAVVAPESSWTFYYCRDNHPRPAGARARWRPRTPVLPGPGDDDGGGAYGWMACASGCCQFYTPPPNEAETYRTTPPRANPNAPDSARSGRGWGRPPWCPADSAGIP